MTGRAEFHFIAATNNYLWIWFANNQGLNSGYGAGTGLTSASNAIDAVKQLAANLVPVGGRIRKMVLDVTIDESV